MLGALGSIRKDNIPEGTKVDTLHTPGISEHGMTEMQSRN